MRNSKVLAGLAMVALTAAAPAFADLCTGLAGREMCITFKYSSGGTNQHTASFGANGVFHLDGDAGTYSCPGKNLIDISYAFAGSEDQSWYGKATNSGKAVDGYGKSLTNGYLYSFKSRPGACGTESAPGGATQRD